MSQALYVRQVQAKGKCHGTLQVLIRKGLQVKT